MIEVEKNKHFKTLLKINNKCINTMDKRRIKTMNKKMDKSLIKKMDEKIDENDKKKKNMDKRWIK